MSPVLVDRMSLVLHVPLQSGSHGSFEEGACVMELVSFVAGEQWNDHPQCACPVIAAFLRAWNDSLRSDEERDRLLKSLIPKLIDTSSTESVEEKRSYLALDWIIRVYTPKWLDLVPALAPHALALRDLEDIADLAGAVAAGKKTAAARDAAGAAARAAAGAAAWDAAGAAARDAAGDAARAAAGGAAWDAAGAAARGAAWDAAGGAARDAAGAAAGDAARDAAGAAAGAAARDAARDAAGAAAGDAAWAAARDAAWAFLEPTTEWLQASALDLVARMIAVSA